MSFNAPLIGCAFGESLAFSSSTLRALWEKLGWKYSLNITLHLYADPSSHKGNGNLKPVLSDECKPRIRIITNSHSSDGNSIESALVLEGYNVFEEISHNQPFKSLLRAAISLSSCICVHSYRTVNRSDIFLLRQIYACLAELSAGSPHHSLMPVVAVCVHGWGGVGGIERLAEDACVRFLPRSQQFLLISPHPHVFKCVTRSVASYDHEHIHATLAPMRADRMYGVKRESTVGLDGLCVTQIVSGGIERLAEDACVRFLPRSQQFLLISPHPHVFKCVTRSVASYDHEHIHATLAPMRADRMYGVKRESTVGLDGLCVTQIVSGLHFMLPHSTIPSSTPQGIFPKVVAKEGFKDNSGLSFEPQQIVAQTTQQEMDKKQGRSMSVGSIGSGPKSSSKVSTAAGSALFLCNFDSLVCVLACESLVYDSERKYVETMNQVRLPTNTATLFKLHRRTLAVCLEHLRTNLLPTIPFAPLRKASMEGLEKAVFALSSSLSQNMTENKESSEKVHMEGDDEIGEGTGEGKGPKGHGMKNSLLPSTPSALFSSSASLGMSASSHQASSSSVSPSSSSTAPVSFTISSSLSPTCHFGIILSRNYNSSIRSCAPVMTVAKRTLTQRLSVASNSTDVYTSVEDVKRTAKSAFVGPAAASAFSRLSRLCEVRMRERLREMEEDQRGKIERLEEMVVRLSERIGVMEGKMDIVGATASSTALAERDGNMTKEMRRLRERIERMEKNMHSMQGTHGTIGEHAGATLTSTSQLLGFSPHIPMSDAQLEEDQQRRAESRDSMMMDESHHLPPHAAAQLPGSVSPALSLLHTPRSRLAIPGSVSSRVSALETSTEALRAALKKAGSVLRKLLRQTPLLSEDYNKECLSESGWCLLSNGDGTWAAVPPDSE
ncbi:hypothetical protein ADUPG1_006739 [Aduncisulcus paluster]|uniref:Uncharacterized protein n=1 Tax=Aduncisulcus paluster TaxID=2918883 RepID=A0ABQ5KJE2_9EUKA|nr:hypothetical protein ADUPG1_006739 [Aduncisulcus paluster]